MNQFEISEKYALLCDQKGSESNYRIYQNIYLATFDLVLSCLQHMSHKNKAAMIPLGTCVSEVVSSVCMKNLITLNVKKENENYLTFLESLDSSTNFVLWTAENEITGEIYYNDQQCAEIHNRLNEKRIFSIQYVNQFRNLVINFENNYSFYLRHPGLFAHGVNPTEVFFSNQQKINFLIAAYQIIQPPAKVSLLSIPNIIPFNYFSHLRHDQKINDRMVLFFDKTIALAVKQYFQLSSSEAFTPAELPSWVTGKWGTWWPESTRINLNNLLVLSPHVLEKDKDFFDKLQKAVDNIDQQSHWTIA